MKFFKATVLVFALSIVSSLFLPATSMALSSASLSQSGTTSQTNGNFTVVINENSDDSINYADAEFSFSGPVSNVQVQVTSPFTAQPYPCSAAYCAIGGATGNGVDSGTRQLAVIRFTLNSPGSVTLSFDASSSLKHTNRDSNGYAVSTTSVAAHGDSATYTYTAPAAPAPTATPPGPAPAAKKQTTASAPAVTTADTPAKTEDKKEVKSAEDKQTPAKADQKSNDDASKKASGHVWYWILGALILLSVASTVARRFMPHQPLVVAPVNKKKPAATRKTGKKSTPSKASAKKKAPKK
jgi:hypothetical protein